MSCFVLCANYKILSVLVTRLREAMAEVIHRDHVPSRSMVDNVNLILDVLTSPALWGRGLISLEQERAFDCVELDMDIFGNLMDLFNILSAARVSRRKTRPSPVSGMVVSWFYPRIYG